MSSENNEEVVPVIVRDNLKSSFDVVFSWSAGEKGAFKSEDIVYQDHSNAVDWKLEAYKFGKTPNLSFTGLLSMKRVL